MESNSAILVILGIIAMLLILVFDKMRPGFTILSVSIIFMALGIISPEELLAGFSNKEMITVAMLFLVGEGVRRSGALTHAIRQILPAKKESVWRVLGRMLPSISAMSMMINNTAVVVIFAPIVKRWAKIVGVPSTKLLIPLSYATILGGMCTLIGTSTNMVVNGLMISSGFKGFSMFEIGQVGAIIAGVGLLYLIAFSNFLLPEEKERKAEEEHSEIEGVEQSKPAEDSAANSVKKTHTVEIMLTARFPGIGRSMSEYSFHRQYGAKISAVRHGGEEVNIKGKRHIYSVGDTLILDADEYFAKIWGETSAFYIVASSVEEDLFNDLEGSDSQKWMGFSLLIFLIVGATVGGALGGSKFDIFPLAAIIMVFMAIARIFPVKRYTKFISWDILIAIASAFAINKAMSNSGVNDLIASGIIDMTSTLGSIGVMASLYIVTMLLTELITNNAAVAVAFPIALSLANQLGIDPKPLFVTICIAASASFSSPIGYQTNLIVQGMGGYKFTDYVKIGLALNIITFIISMIMIPRIWHL
ncbi:MAG: SLC13 family permease [Rikenellaceae bacterium]